jgi:POT family proton-dependent oligopeptide transporter
MATPGTPGPFAPPPPGEYVGHPRGLWMLFGAGIFGGFVADRYLGYRHAILLGGALMAAGLFLLLSRAQRVGYILLTLFAPFIDRLMHGVK